MSFEYFDYGEERRFSFLQVPKLLLTEERYRKLSGDAKLLYSLMLDRMDLSRKNRWYDERGYGDEIDIPEGEPEDEDYEE